MRCYHLCNFYLSSIQQGIQSAHAQMELFNKYTYDDDPQEDLLFDWSKNHKTMIVLNGGMLSDMVESLEFLEDDQNEYPFAPFYESGEVLGGILTNIAIILPEKIYLTAEWVRNKKLIFNYESDRFVDYGLNSNDWNRFRDWEFSGYDVQLILWLNTFGLAK